MPSSTEVVPDQVRAEMSRTNDLFNLEVFGKKNFTALDDVYTETATILPPGSPVVSGRPAIKQFWESAITSLNATSALLTSLDVMPAGDDLVEIGKVVLAIQPSGQSPSELEAKYVVHWRQEAGRWKWHVDIWNLNA